MARTEILKRTNTIPQRLLAEPFYFTGRSFDSP